MTIRLLTADDVLIRIRAMTKDRSQREIARYLGVNESMLSHILSGRKSPGLAILKKMRLERVMAYRELV